MARIGGAGEVLSDEQIGAFVREQLASVDLDGRSLCVIVPDGTRSCPLRLLLSAVRAAVEDRVTRLSVVVALGTHAAMTEPELAAHLGCPGRNHEWWNPATFVDLGRIPAERIAELSGGMLRWPVDVRINRAVVEHDVTLIVGPVFPHEVVGFSGGNKYLFPGVSGRELIDLSHWLGALITSAEIIGTRGVTPVRALIDEAASMVPGRRYALCVVTRSGGEELHAVAFGVPEDAWAEAAGVSAEAHIRYLEAPVRRVLSLVSPRYDDLWTGAKGFYKVEPVVADGGEVVLYAPHIREVSVTPREIESIGYHCRDYFVEQWDRFEHVPWGDLAHSTHLRGAGSYDPASGEERFRVEVALATGISEERTRAVNLGYRDPAGIDPAAWAADPDTLVVPNAGEVLYRLR
ncbi:MAG: lactate racemase domain-containing protein [Gaiellaceae bacterium]